MHSLIPSWHRWEDLLAGEQVDESETAWILEGSSEYQLRRILRRFDQREQLFQRFGSFLFGPRTQLDDDQVTALATELLRELERLAQVLELPEQAAAAATAQIVVGGKPKRPEWCDSDAIWEAATDRRSPTQDSEHFFYNLAEIAYSHSPSLWTREYLIAPLVDFEMNLDAYITLEKSARSVWLDGGQLVVTDAGVHATDQSNQPWIPELDWPTEAEIAQHVIEEVQASDPNAPGSVLTALLQSSSPFAVSAAAYHPNLPTEAIADLAASPDVMLRTAAARNTSTPPQLLAQLANDTDADVRLGVVVNRNTTKDVIEGFAKEPDSHVLSVVVGREHATLEAIERAAESDYWRARSAAAKHAKTPQSLLPILAADEQSDVRTQVAKRDDTPVDLLIQLASDEAAWTRAAAVANPRTPDHVVELLSSDDAPQVVRAIEARKANGAN